MPKAGTYETAQENHTQCVEVKESGLKQQALQDGVAIRDALTVGGNDAHDNRINTVAVEKASNAKTKLIPTKV